MSGQRAPRPAGEDRPAQGRSEEGRSAQSRSGQGLPGAAGTPRRRALPDDGPVVPDRSAEDRPEAWGERPDEDDDERYLRDRPPHW